ncbi:unnamed protein product [Orchesella dallaii]|uniref:Uncharacterized protein n=1 Tax=Orchesella dallaii TaxID=48710 RepID=A0ABP1RYW8_9HEXA
MQIVLIRATSRRKGGHNFIMLMVSMTMPVRCIMSAIHVSSVGGLRTSPGFCGVRLTPSLNTLDDDAINASYDCQGCKRHRWRIAEFLTDHEKRNMQSVRISGLSSARGEVSPGRFDMEKKPCFIRFGTDLLEIK